jgi:hypothetical protein
MVVADSYLAPPGKLELDPEDFVADELDAPSVFNKTISSVACGDSQPLPLFVDSCVGNSQPMELTVDVSSGSSQPLNILVDAAVDVALDFYKEKMTREVPSQQQQRKRKLSFYDEVDEVVEESRKGKKRSILGEIHLPNNGIGFKQRTCVFPAQLGR